MQFNNPEKTKLNDSILISIKDQRGNNFSGSFIKSLLWQLEISRIHSQEAYSIENKLQNLQSGSAEIISLHLYHFWAHFEACIVTVNSLPEIFAQWLNQIALTHPIPNKDVTLEKVCAGISQTSTFKMISQRYDVLKVSMASKFVKCFSNVHKHRQMTEVYFALTKVLENKFDQGAFWIEPFSYEGSQFQRMPAVQGLEYAANVGEWVIDILCDVQNRAEQMDQTDKFACDKFPVYP